MTITRKLQLAFALTAAGALLGGACGIIPLLRVTHLLENLPAPLAALLGEGAQLHKNLAIASASSLAAAVLGLVILSSSARRLTRLCHNVQDFSSAPATNAIAISGNDEVALLGNAFDQLHEKLRELQAKQVRGEELSAAKRFTDNVIKSMFDVLIVADPQLRIITINKAACELLEYSEKELLGRPMETLFKEEPMLLCAPIRERLKNNTTGDFEAVYVTRSGRQISVLLSASTMLEIDGRPAAIITIAKDITARKEIERELLTAKANAEAASRAKSAFVANMSHEIRTPMTAILGYADLLLKQGQSAEERSKCIQTIRRNGEHLLNIINDILDVSKIEAGKMTVERISCSPCQIVADVCALMKVRAMDKNLSFDARYIGAIPHSIQSDPTRLRQILMNLIGNAIKFTQTGGVKLVISMSDPAESPAPHIRFDVIDTGIGLTPRQQESLFKPFAQADSSTTRKFGGTGLGLTISKRLAGMLGGDLVLRSIAGEGSTFSLTVETGSLKGVAMLDSPKALIEASELKNDAIGPAQLAGRVLVAEDGPDNRVLIEYHLRQAGLDVILVENGLLARDQALDAQQRGKPFDLILMDMQMPEMDGYDATRQLRANGYTHPIIALTAHAMQSDRDKCIETGCDDFVGKPLDYDQLMRVLRKYLQEKSPGEQHSKPAPSLVPRSEPVLTQLMARGPTAKLVMQFLGGLPARISAIQEAIAAGDMARLKVLSHQLKGAAGGYGFPSISQLAARIEAASTQPADAAALSDQLHALRALCEQAHVSAQAA